MAEALASKLIAELGDRMAALILYGSAVRGGFDSKVSDINLLIVLRETSPELHTKLQTALKDEPRVQAMVVGLHDLERTMLHFGLKFLSIRRSYRVLYGQDVLASFSLDRSRHCEQAEEALRNLQLRLSRAYVLPPQPRRYSRYVVANFASLVVNLSEALRLRDVELPVEFPARMPLLRQHFGAEVSALEELLELRKAPRELSRDEAAALHTRLLALIAKALQGLGTP